MKTATFNKLPKQRQRRLILLDVLKQLKSPVVKVQPMTYFIAQFKPSVLPQHARKDTIELQNKLPLMTHCEVCAKGALFLSAVTLGNNCQVLNLEEVELGDGQRVFSRTIARYFSQKTLDLAETAFEVSQSTPYSEPTTPYEHAINFGCKYPDPTKRLIAIIKNMLKNNGVFKPT